MLFVSRDVSGIPSQETNVPVYMQDWLTDIAMRGTETRRVIVTENGKPLGSLTVWLQRNGLGMKQGYNLPWARVCGPHFPEGISEEKRTSTTRQLVRQLPRNVSFFLKLAHESDFMLFLEEGFKPVLENNYFIPPAGLPTLHAALSKMSKRHVKQAQRDLIVTTTTPDGFIEIYEADLARRRRKPYAPLAIARLASPTPTSGAFSAICATQPGKWSLSLAQISANSSLISLAYSFALTPSPLVKTSSGGIGYERICA